MTHEPDTGSADLEIEALVGRIVDGEATPADCAAFERLAASEQDWWRTLARRQLDMSILAHGVAERTGAADRVDVPARRRLPGVNVLLAVSGWAAVLVVGVTWALLGSVEGRSGTDDIERVGHGGVATRELSPDEHFRKFIEADWVLGELDPILLETEPLGDGRLRLRIIRRIEEYVDTSMPPEALVDDKGALKVDPADLRRMQDG